MKEIARESDNRFDWWIMKQFQVLPTDERFINLTEEQKELIWQHYLLDNPEIAKKVSQFDPEFEEEWNSLGKDEETSKPEETYEDIDIEQSMEEFLKERPEMSLPENYIEQKLKERGINLEKPKDNKPTTEEWEEVDD